MQYLRGKTGTKVKNKNMKLVTVSLEYAERTSKKAVHAVNFEARALREKCSNTEFFLVRIFPPSD